MTDWCNRVKEKSTSQMYLFLHHQPAWRPMALSMVLKLSIWVTHKQIVLAVLLPFKN